MKKLSIKEILGKTAFEMLNKTTVDRLTVKMILDETGVSKSSFYRHFQDIDAVVYYAFLDQFYQFLPNGARDYPELLLEEWSHVLLQFMRNHLRFFKNTLWINATSNTLITILSEDVGGRIMKELERLRGNAEWKATNEELATVKLLSHTFIISFMWHFESNYFKMTDRQFETFILNHIRKSFAVEAA